MNELVQEQFSDINQSVNVRLISTSSVVPSTQFILDFTGRPQKLRQMLKSDYLPAYLRKIMLISCNISSMQEVFERRKKNRFIDTGLQMVVKTVQYAAELSKYFVDPKDLNQKAQFIPSLKTTHYMHLKELYLDNNSIESINQRIIQEMQQLKKFSIYNNFVEVFPSFANNPNLTSVNARRNQIKTIMISPTELYLKEIEMDWMDYINVRTMQNSRYQDGMEQFWRTKIHQNKLNNVFLDVIMELKKQKYTLEAHIECNEFGMSFGQFMNAFLAIKQFKEEFELEFIGYNLRLAIVQEFDLFIDYCKEISRKVNFNELTYKGNSLLEYALENEYQYGIELFIEGLNRFRPKQQTIYQIMELACRHSHFGLLKQTYGIVLHLLQQLSQQQLSYSLNNVNSSANFTIHQLFRLLFGLSSSQAEQPEAIIWSMQSAQSLPQQRSHVQQNKTKFDHLIIQTLLNFNFNKQSPDILKILIELAQLRLRSHLIKLNTKGEKSNLKKKSPNVKVNFRQQDVKKSESPLKIDRKIILNQDCQKPVLSSEISLKIARNQIQIQKKGIQLRQGQLKDENEEKERLVFDIQIPSETMLRTLTKESVQKYIHGIMWIREDEQLRKYFRLKEEIPYTKHKNLLEIAASIRNNEFLQDLLWNLNFNVFNRNQSGKLSRTGKILPSNKKLLYKMEIRQLENRFSQTHNPYFKNHQRNYSESRDSSVFNQNPRQIHGFGSPQKMKHSVYKFKTYQSTNDFKKPEYKVEQEINQQKFTQIQNARGSVLGNLKNEKEKPVNSKKLKLSKNYDASLIQIQKNSSIGPSRFASYRIEQLQYEIDKIREERDQNLTQLDDQFFKYNNDDENISEKEQQNSEYEQIQEVLWQNSILSHMQSELDGQIKPNIARQNISVAGIHNQNRGSILNNLSKNLLSCGCVEPELQEESCIDCSVEPYQHKLPQKSFRVALENQTSIILPQHRQISTKPFHNQPCQKKPVFPH